MNKINVVFCLEDKTGDFCRHLAVTIISILENTKEKIVINVLHDESLTRDNINKIKSMVESKNQEIKFYEIKRHIDLKSIPAVKYLSKGALYKFLIVDTLPKELDKVLYLDTDIVVNLDIKDLFNIDIKNYTIAAIRDKGAVSNPKIYSREIPVDLNKYFNSGVILFNLKRMRVKYNLFEQSMDTLKKYPNEPFVDQPPFNYLLQNDCLLVDEKYNKFPDQDTKINEKAIFHFAGAYKPWKSRNYPIDKIYWKYFILTPWGDNIEGLLKYYSQTVETLDKALLTYPTGSKGKFFKSVVKRTIKEIKIIKRKFYRGWF